MCVLVSMMRRVHHTQEKRKQNIKRTLFIVRQLTKNGQEEVEVKKIVGMCAFNYGFSEAAVKDYLAVLADMGAIEIIGDKVRLLYKEEEI